MKYTLVVTAVLFVVQPEDDYPLARMSHEVDFGTLEHCEFARGGMSDAIEGAMATTLRAIWQREADTSSHTHYVETHAYCDRRQGHGSPP